MNPLIYLLPTLGALIGVISVLITFYCLWKKLEKSKGEILENLAENVKKEEIQEILNDKMDDLMQDFKEQIPMGAMLFSPSLSEKIKNIAKEGLLKMVPSFKKRFIQRFSQGCMVESALIATLRPLLFRIIFYAATVGFVLGWIWTFID